MAPLHAGRRLRAVSAAAADSGNGSAAAASSGTSDGMCLCLPWSVLLLLAFFTLFRFRLSFNG